MSTQRPGFTLVELIVGLLVGTLVLTAAYQALIAQERSYRTTGAVIHDQDALRTVVGVLESELREIAAIGGAGIGETDILMATSDSIRFRASRKLGFVCAVSPSTRQMTVWNAGAAFVQGEGLLIFIENDPTTYTDDRWDTGVAETVTAKSDACPASPTGSSDQRIDLKAHALGGVVPGSPVRGFEELTYGLYEVDGQWGLGRKDSDGKLGLLVGGLAGPGEGLTFEYRNQAGVVTTDRTAVASIRIGLQTAPHPSTGAQPASLTSTIYLRNN